MDIERLRMYKTAYSPLDECYVGIVRVWPDIEGRPLLLCRLADSTDRLILFREEELSQFVF